MKKTLLLSALTCGLLLTTLQAKPDTHALVKQEIEKTKKEFKQAPKEVSEALKESALAMNSLQNNKKEEAKKNLKKAIENFDKAFKNNPNLDILPLDETIDIYESLASTKEIKTILKTTKEYISNYKLNEARAALAPLRDEMYIKQISIPMKVFPLAAKDALKTLEKGKVQEAMAIMAEGYSTFIVEEAIVPLPLLNAQELIVEAASSDKSKKEEATKLLNAAQDELERANVLGYTDSHSHEYKVLNEAIDRIKEEIKGKNVVVKLYDELKEKFSSLVHKSKTTQEKAKEKIDVYQQKETVKAVKDTKQFEKDAKSDEAKTLTK